MAAYKYFLATDKESVFHYGEFNPQTQTVSTGQPFYMEFDTQQELIDELEKYNIAIDDTDL